MALSIPAHRRTPLTLVALLATASFHLTFPATAFEGRITAESLKGGQTTALLYTIGSEAVRIELTGSDRPNPVDVGDLKSGALTLLLPRNQSYIRQRPSAVNVALRPGMPTGVMPGGLPSRDLPPGIGPQDLPVVSSPAGIAPANFSGESAFQMPRMPQMPSGVGPQTGSAVSGLPSMAAIPAMPMMPMPGDELALKPTGMKTNLLGYVCERFELRQRGEVMEIWATDQLLPFLDYVRDQPHRVGRHAMEERWGALLAAKRLFPLHASLRFENGTERFRFAVRSITPQKLKAEDAALFQPPADYQEVEPLPF